MKVNAKAEAAMDVEWQRLGKVPRKVGKFDVWDEEVVQEWSSVRRSAQKTNTKAHVGLIFGIVLDKNHELPEQDPIANTRGEQCSRCSRATTSRMRRAIGPSSRSWGHALQQCRQHVVQTRTV